MVHVFVKVLFVLGIIHVACSDPLRSVVNAKSKDCYFVELSRNRIVEFSWQVLSGGQKDINIWVDYRGNTPTVEGKEVYSGFHRGIDEGMVFLVLFMFL